MSGNRSDRDGNVPEGRHLDPSRMEAYLDGELPAGERSAFEDHVGSCRRCRSELASWRTLFRQLEELPDLEPSPGFAERVLEEVALPGRAPAPAAPAVLDWLRDAAARAAAWSRRLVPQTRGAWAAAVAVAMAPVTALGVGGYWLLSHPGITPGSLASYVALRLGSAGDALLDRLVGGLLESPILYHLYELAEALARSPEGVAVGGLLFTALAASAVWILYANLFSTRSVDVTHAHYSF